MKKEKRLRRIGFRLWLLLAWIIGVMIGIPFSLFKVFQYFRDKKPVKIERGAISDFSISRASKNGTVIKVVAHLIRGSSSEEWIFSRMPGGLIKCQSESGVFMVFLKQLPYEIWAAFMGWPIESLLPRNDLVSPWTDVRDEELARQLEREFWWA